MTITTSFVFGEKANLLSLSVFTAELDDAVHSTQEPGLNSVMLCFYNLVLSLQPAQLISVLT